MSVLMHDIVTAVLVLYVALRLWLRLYGETLGTTS